MQQEVRGHLQSFGWHESTCSLYPASQSTAYMRTLSLHNCGLTGDCYKKQEADLLDDKGASKAFYGYPWAGESGKW